MHFWNLAVPTTFEFLISFFRGVLASVTTFYSKVQGSIPARVLDHVSLSKTILQPPSVYVPRKKSTSVDKNQNAYFKITT